MEPTARRREVGFHFLRHSSAFPRAPILDRLEPFFPRVCHIDSLCCKVAKDSPSQCSVREAIPKKMTSHKMANVSAKDSQNLSMNWAETWNLALEALRANKLRAALTMLGVVIGSACIVLVVTVALAGRRYIGAQ